MSDTVVTINQEMIVTLVMIRIACRALSDDERSVSGYRATLAARSMDYWCR